MTESKMLEYGRCLCDGVYERRAVEVRMSVQGRVIVLTNVPQGVCPLCGSRVYKAAVLETIEALMKGEPHDRRSNEWPV
jgi:YgiT-type zinc finger domain-containing protein